MNNTRGVLLKSYNLIEKYIFVLSPILTLILFLILSKINNIAPVGENTVSWCDLNQQGIPLLNQLKDILEGKQSINGNMLAGGMSYFGVFFFYIASPFSFLVIFVDKSYMQAFVDVIIMLKMATAAFTFSFYLKKKYKSLDGIMNLALSILYSFSGYVMMYFQTLTWLDMVYLFPLLMLSVDLLLEKEKIVPYIIFITLIVSINYYIGIMAVFYVIFYFSLSIYFRRKDNNIKDISFKFIFASIISILLSMAVLIPSFIDYSESSRTISIIDSIKNSAVITPYQTAVPLILGTTVLIPFLFNNKQNDKKIIKLILLALLSIPIIIDPINKMWHYGSYQAFPCRFAFINTFLMLDIISMLLYEDKIEDINKNNIIKWIIGLSLSLLLIIFSFIFENVYVKNNMTTLQTYTHTLWGNSTSFESLLRYYAVILVIVSIIYFLYKIKTIPKKGLGLIFLFFSIIEAIFSFNVYMVSASHDTKSYEKFYEIVNVIKDDSYYNVKTDYKIQNVNDIGGAGYNSFGHYTSLTPKSYMDSLKKMGYSSYWMEVGSYGGTILSDAILINKYTISYGNDIYSKYNTEHYNIKENKVFPLGLVTKTDLTKYEYLNDNSRALMQKSIVKSLFNRDDIVNIYNYSYLDNVIDNKPESGFSYNILSTEGKIIYDIDIKDKQALYFEAIDKYSNNLYQSINESIKIKVNNYVPYSKYPNQSSNGFLNLGIFEDQKIRVEITINKSISGSSFSLFSIDENKYDELFNNPNHADMKYINKHFEGTYEASEDTYMFLPIAYSKDINVNINNKKVKVFRVFDGFVGIKLEKGINNINISFTKFGLIPGMFISLLGLGLLISYFVLKDLNKLNIIFDNDKIKCISYYMIIVGSLILLFILYLLPIIINIIGYIR